MNKSYSKIRHIQETNIRLDEQRNPFSGEDLKNLYSSLGDDEEVSLSDDTGTLFGRKVSKKEYLEEMLTKAIREKNWSKVNHALLYLKAKM